MPRYNYVSEHAIGVHVSRGRLTDRHGIRVPFPRNDSLNDSPARCWRGSAVRGFSHGAPICGRGGVENVRRDRERRQPRGHSPREKQVTADGEARFPPAGQAYGMFSIRLTPRRSDRVAKPDTAWHARPPTTAASHQPSATNRHHHHQQPFAHPNASTRSYRPPGDTRRLKIAGPETEKGSCFSSPPPSALSLLEARYQSFW